MTKNEVAVMHCKTAGHKIEPVVFQQALDPGAKVLVPTEIKVMCVKCGLTVEEIRDSKSSRTPRKKKGSTEDFSALDREEGK